MISSTIEDVGFTFIDYSRYCHLLTGSIESWYTMLRPGNKKGTIEFLYTTAILKFYFYIFGTDPLNKVEINRWLNRNINRYRKMMR